MSIYVIVADVSHVSPSVICIIYLCTLMRCELRRDVNIVLRLFLTSPSCFVARWFMKWCQQPKPRDCSLQTRMHRRINAARYLNISRCNIMNCVSWM